jgi:hypothetical protein
MSCPPPLGFGVPICLFHWKTSIDYFGKALVAIPIMYHIDISSAVVVVA